MQLLQLHHMSSIPLQFPLPFTYSSKRGGKKQQKKTICCHLVWLKSRGPLFYHRQPHLEDDSDWQRNKMEESTLESQQEPWIISSIIKSHCTEWACSPRGGHLLVSQQASSASLYHSNTCEVLCQPPSATNQPPHYYKPHTLVHHCYPEWTVDWRRELLCASVFMHALHVTDIDTAKLFLWLYFSSDHGKPAPAVCKWIYSLSSV